MVGGGPGFEGTLAQPVVSVLGSGWVGGWCAYGKCRWVYQRGEGEQPQKRLPALL